MTLAGFFGLFDYSKPGPGVDKNAPQKKGFVVFFEIYFRKFWKLCVANLLYVLVSLPVVTGGLAEVGLTYITRNFAREKHVFVAGDFFDTIKKNWKQALPMGLINLVLTAVLVFDIWFFGAPLFMNHESGKEPGIFNYILLAFMLSVGFVVTFAKYYISMLIVTFRLSLKQIYKNAFILAFLGLKRNLLIFAVQALVLALGFLLAMLNWGLGLTLIILLYVFWYPAFRSFLIQYNIFPLIKKVMIDPYYEAHPEEGKKERRDLNIETEIPEEEKEETVFRDMGRTDKEEEEKEKKPLNIPRQYTEQEMRRINKRIQQTRQGAADDDDDTI